MNPLVDDEFAAFIGIDWANDKHDICLLAIGSEKREFRVLVHQPKVIDEWAHSLRKRFAGKPIAVCLELAKGPIVYALQKYDCFVLFPINPATLAKYRQAFTPSHAKDDPSDAALALDFLLHHRDKLKRLKPQSEKLRKLMRLVEQRRRLVGDKTRFSNRLIDALKQYYPQALECFGDRDTAVFCDFLERWPTLKQAQQAHKTTLTAFFKAHRVPAATVIEKRIRILKEAMALTIDPAVIEPNQLLVSVLVDQLRVSIKAVARFDKEIQVLTHELPDAALFDALPGAGDVFTPRLLVAFGEDRERFEDAAELQKATGIAPVTERSGNKCWVHWRTQCSVFLRQTIVEWTEQTINRSFWATAYYRQQRSKGATHSAAVRALAFKWIRILYRCWKTRTPYDESTYLMALQKRGSSLLQTITAPIAALPGQ
jgi:transposase